MTLKLLQQLAKHAQHHPDSEAVRQACAGQSICYGQLYAAVRSLAVEIRQNVPAGGVVILCGPNQPQYTVSFLAAMRAGVRLFPLSPELSEPELRFAAERTAAAMCIGTENALNALAGIVAKSLSISNVTSQSNNPLPPSMDEDHSDQAELLLQTSGTTAAPKIVRRNGRSLNAVAANTISAVGMTDQDRVLMAVPLCHSYGMEHGLLAPIMAGSCVHLCDGFDLHTVTEELSAGGISIFPGVPYFFEVLSRLASEGQRFNSLRCAYSAGAPLPTSVYQSLKKRLGIELGQLYGSTEIGSVTFNAPWTDGFDPQSVGQPMDGVVVRILDVDSPQLDEPLPAGVEGHVVVSAPSMLTGYMDKESTMLREGFFFTGDLGRLNDRGGLRITGRIKLLIDIGGQKVNPFEVEHVLAGYPAVDQCVVVSVPMTDTVSRLKAIVTLRDKQNGFSVEQLRQYSRSRLATYKVPRIFEVRDTLERLPTGKIDRQATGST